MRNSSASRSVCDVAVAKVSQAASFLSADAASL
jgi:hypothetical protein